MKQLNFNKNDPKMGDISGILRVDKGICFFKFKQSQQAQSIVANLQSKGAIITPGRKWIKANLFGENKEVILGREHFNVDDKTDIELEEILFKFFCEKYTQAGFECKIKLKADGAGK